MTMHGFSKKPVMEGAGGGAGEVYAWAIENAEKISCVYAENPRMRSAHAKTQPLDNLAPLAKANVPLLHVCGSFDPWFTDNTLEVEKRYRSLGGKIQVIVKKGQGHYPLAPEDPAPVVEFIVRAST
jgi:pimeloyl-ACP methyl ester carboxylesterase